MCVCVRGTWRPENILWETFFVLPLGYHAWRSGYKCLYSRSISPPLKNTPGADGVVGSTWFQHLHHICVFWVFWAGFSVGSWYVLTLMIFRLLFTVVWPSTNLPVWIGEGCRRLYCNIFWFSRIINIPSWASKKKWWEWEKWVSLSDFFYDVCVCLCTFLGFGRV